MKKILNDKKFKMSIIYTFIFGFIAHGFFYFNVFLSHDSSIFFQNDIGWQISLGRFLHPIIYTIRGNYYVPWLVGIISMFFVSLSVYLIVKMLPIKSKLGIILTSGILIANYTITCLNATYSHETDIYMISLFFSVLGVYLARNMKKGWLLAPIAFFISLGLYQSFLNVMVFLFVLLIYIDLLNKKTFKEEFLIAIKYIIIILVSLLLYYIGMKVSMKIFNISPESGYNGLTNVGNYGSIKNILKNLYTTYAKVILFVIRPIGYSSISMIIANSLIFITCFIMNIKLVIRSEIKKMELIFLIILLLIMPFCINVVCFISQGMEHELMIYSFFLLYIFDIFIMEKYIEGIKNNKSFKNMFSSYLIMTMIFLIIYNFCVYSNEVYYIKKNIYQNTLLTLNRIVYSIESIEGYEAGKTKVAFVGSLNSSKLAKPYKKYNTKVIGNDSVFAVTYKSSYTFFINGPMHMNMNICGEEETEKYLKKSIVKSMKSYPSKDSIKIVNDVVVVKLS